jgi:hypothetical protein
MNQSAMVQFSGRKEDCPDAYSTFQSLQEDVVPANERQDFDFPGPISISLENEPRTTLEMAT